LQGKAVEVYQRLADKEVDDYEVLKVQLLTRFRLTEGGYRKKFKIYICFSFVSFTLHAYLVLC